MRLTVLAWLTMAIDDWYWSDDQYDDRDTIVMTDDRWNC